MYKYNMIGLVGLVILSIGLLGATITLVQAQDPLKPFDDPSYFKPVVENVNLLVNGSTPYIANLSKSFDYIQAITFNLVWTSDTVNLSSFGAIPGLPNGVMLAYDSVNMGITFHNISELMGIGWILYLNTDGNSPKLNHLASTIIFTKFNPYGLELSGTHSFTCWVQDDLLGAGVSFYALVQGYDYQEYELEVSYDFLEEIYFFDEITDIPLAIIFLPIALILAGDFMVAVVGVIIGMCYLVVIVAGIRRFAEAL